MESRKLTDLHPALQPIAAEFLRRCDAFLAKEGARLLVTCTYRDNAEQARLYAQGRTTPGAIVTNAQPGQSKHNCTRKDPATGAVLPASRALDVVALRLSDNALLYDRKTPAGLARWQRIAAEGEALGLEWAGRWVSFNEFPHFQLKASVQ